MSFSILWFSSWRLSASYLENVFSQTSHDVFISKDSDWMMYTLDSFTFYSLQPLVVSSPDRPTSIRAMVFFVITADRIRIFVNHHKSGWSKDTVGEHFPHYSSPIFIIHGWLHYVFWNLHAGFMFQINFIIALKYHIKEFSCCLNETCDQRHDVVPSVSQIKMTHLFHACSFIWARVWFGVTHGDLNYCAFTILHSAFTILHSAFTILQHGWTTCFYLVKWDFPL